MGLFIDPYLSMVSDFLLSYTTDSRCCPLYCCKSLIVVPDTLDKG